MAAALFGKKDAPDADAPEPSGGDCPGGLAQLTAQLAQIGELWAEANGRIVSYLAQRESQPAGGVSEGTDDVARQIAALAEKIDGLAGSAAPAADRPVAEPADDAVTKVLDPLRERLESIEAAVKTLSERSTAPAHEEGPSNASILEAVRQLPVQLDNGLQQITDLLAPPEDVEENEPQGPTTAEWEWAILGPDLTQDPALAFARQQLIAGAFQGDPGAQAFAGQLLVFHSAPPERLPQLLKEIGEAFYRWQPKTAPGTGAFEDALVEWLRRRCEEVGIYNTIALVDPGERFDSARHTAASRGVEITDVQGWIVLRDNGKVYTKATVSVR
ncbi:MAG: hypothetical protein ACYTG0_47095 [Planctomycetota bacterium]|jgi:hypothetical protein